MSNKYSYWKKIFVALKTLTTGLGLTFKHFKGSTKQVKAQKLTNPQYFQDYNEGLITVQYPHESLPVPDNGRYRLHNEIDDCIVCDKCAKICPVDCIAIEPIKSPEVYGHTSDGTPKRIHAAKFDIDMAKCCFCGLCTTVCPTECLTMTKTYDFSEYDVDDHNYAFASLSEREAKQKMNVWEAFEAEKNSSASARKDSADQPSKSKPTFKPRIKPKNSNQN